jgi:uncharacterized membrane protein YraQ (UPF0718 family)
MFQAMWHILLELAPWLLIGVAVAAALHALLPPDFMRRHLSGRWSVAKAALIGVPLPLCSCAVIPVGLSLKRQGATSGASVAFLISTPQTGVDSILVSGAMLGLPFALFKMVSAFIIGLVGGVLTNRFSDDDELSIADAAPSCCQGGAGDPALAILSPPPPSRFNVFLTESRLLLQSIWRWLAVGIVVSAAITYFLPPDSLAQLGAGGGVAAMLLALVVGMPLYVCAVASVPIAAALVHAGFPVGAALVFLIAGPASNIATMGAVYRGLGRRTFVIYMSTIAVGSLLFGWAFQSLIDLTPLHAEAAHAHADHETQAWWAVASGIALLALMAWFAVQELTAAMGGRGSRRAAAKEPTGPLYTLE